MLDVERICFAGWSTLDQLLTSEKIVSGLDIEMEMDSQEISESERNLTLPYANALFPMFRATQRALDIDPSLI